MTFQALTLMHQSHQTCHFPEPIKKDEKWEAMYNGTLNKIRK